jgi:hypothetical protein
MIPGFASWPAYHPRESDTIQDTGLPFSLLLELVLKHAFFEGTSTLGRLAERTRLSTTVIHAVYRHMHKEQLCDTRSMIENDYEISLTNKGRTLAEIALKKSQYAGPAPVPLSDYRQAVKAQALQMNVKAGDVRGALSDLIVTDDVVRELGTALVTGGAILLYGSTGNGKTSIAERLHVMFNDYIYVPYAVEVAGEIVTVFDPLIHREETEVVKAMEEESDAADPRWVLCHRPMVKVGGEMRVEMLDTRMDEMTRICMAPLQMKANNGILLIDDFGRQRITPRDLLNRWIVPLDRRTDILSLWSGVSFEIPFEVLVVFATNLPLSDLAEDAFLRRLRNKIKIDSVTDEQFRQITRRVCDENSLPYTDEIGQYVLKQCQQHSPRGLRACFPHDLVKIVRGTAAFEDRPPTFGKDDVDEAVKVYFVR